MTGRDVAPLNPDGEEKEHLIDPQVFTHSTGDWLSDIRGRWSPKRKERREKSASEGTSLSLAP